MIYNHHALRAAQLETAGPQSRLPRLNLNGCIQALPRFQRRIGWKRASAIMRKLKKRRILQQ